MLDKNGFKRKTYTDLLNDMSVKTKELFGADANVTERAFLGILIRIMAWFLSLAWQAIEAVYHSSFRKSAEGVQLDKLLPNAGIERNLDEYATGKVTLTGTPFHTEPSGFLVGTSSDINFETIEDVTLSDTGEGVVPIVAKQIGTSGNVGAGLINTIVNPSADITSVINPSKTDGGRNKETDIEARERADLTIEGLGSTTVAAIRTGLLKIPSIRAALVIENTSLDTDQFNTPGKAVQSFVLGGTDEEIAETILTYKAGGIQAYGSTVISTLDISGNEQLIGFTRATEVNLHAKVKVVADNTFTDNGINDMKNILVNYIGGVKTDGTITKGLNMSEKVVNAKASASLFSVTGVTDVELELSIDGTVYTTGNIDININEVAQIDANNIEVTANV